MKSEHAFLVERRKLGPAVLDLLAQERRRKQRGAEREGEEGDVEGGRKNPRKMVNVHSLGQDHRMPKLEQAPKTLIKNYSILSIQQNQGRCS
jgi:hypothetical protein